MKRMPVVSAMLPLVLVALLAPALADDTDTSQPSDQQKKQVTVEKTVTGPNGKTATKNVAVTKDGNTVTRDGSTTGPNGGTVNSHDTWTKDGNTTTHEGTITKQGAAAKKKPRAPGARPRPRH